MTEQTGLVQVQPGQIARQDMSGQQLETRAETGTAALAAQAEAEVRAEFALAKMYPRDLDDVRIRLLQECKRPAFAEMARYNKPIGRGIRGFSVHFARAAARCMGFVHVSPRVVWDDPYKRISRVTVTDRESGVTHCRDIVVEKTVERSRLRDGQVALSVRTNSKGEATYTVAATEEEMLGKQFNWESRAIRNCIMAHIPGDLQDEAQALIEETKRSAAKQDPDGTRKRVADGFAALGIMPADLKRYLGHDLASCTPAELTQLREVWNTLKQGEATWQDFMEAKHGKPNGEPQKNGLEGVTERLSEEQAKETRETALLERVKRLTDDEAARADLMKEIAAARAGGGGIEAAEKHLDEHPVFGVVPPKAEPKKRGKGRPKLEE